MAYAWMTEPRSGHSRITLRRNRKNEFIVYTEKELTDEQMDSLYWIILWMHDTGRRTWDLINDCMEEAIKTKS